MHVAGRCAAVAAAACAVAYAQDPQFRRGVEPVTLEAIGASRFPASGPVTELRFGRDGGRSRVELALRAPVEDVAVARIDAARYLVFAGGVREPLDVYVVDERARWSTLPIETGGTRLPATFETGAEHGGSWPVCGVDGLLAFAFEKDAGISFRAMDDAGNVLVARDYPGEQITGFAIAEDLETNELRVTFSNGSELRCRHPFAPTVELDRRELHCVVAQPGETARAVVEIANRGRRVLKAAVEVEGDGFYLGSSAQWTLAPAATTSVVVDYAPHGVGRTDGRLVVRTALFDLPDTVVTLHGECMPGVAERPGGGGASPAVGATAPLPPLPALAAALIDHRLVRPTATSLAFEGFVAIPQELYAAAEPPVLWLENVSADRRTTAGVEDDGWVRCTIPAGAGDVVRAALVDGRTDEPAYLALGRVLPVVEIDGDELVVTGHAEAPFWIDAVVVEDGGAIGRALRSWYGRLDPAGQVRIALEVIAGDRSRGVTVIARLRRDRGGFDASEPCLIGAR